MCTIGEVSFRVGRDPFCGQALVVVEPVGAPNCVWFRVVLSPFRFPAYLVDECNRDVPPERLC